MLIALIFSGCSTPDAEPGSIVLPPEDLAAPWDDAYADDDDIGGRFAMGAQVLGPDGLPAVGVRVGVLSGWDGAEVSPVDARGGRLVLDVRTNEVLELGTCGAALVCTWLELVTNVDGRVDFDVFVDVAPESGASVPLFISAADDVASVDIELVDSIVVH
ncbi:hypothetical protein LBMAG42_03910 [Deltaproteobacteria bacterium]|nr:hypothetical protein LBMAG42_03910 [Deltaproteobacteria bacterium]